MKEVKYGDRAWFKDEGMEKWGNRIFLGRTPNNEYLTVTDQYEEQFNRGNPFLIVSWDEMTTENPELDWEPKEGETYYYIIGTGDIKSDTNDNAKYDRKVRAYHNYFKTKEQADSAQKDFKRCLAVIRACKIVDPDFVPDWFNENQTKWFVWQTLKNKNWNCASRLTANFAPAYVSTKEKAEQVCELLTKWGV